MKRTEKERILLLLAQAEQWLNQLLVGGTMDQQHAILARNAVEQAKRAVENVEIEKTQ
jgi:hypothetical protein